MENKKNPNFFYKYTKASNAIAILKNCSINLTNPKCFNDPYDANPPFILKRSTKITKEKLIEFCNEQERRNGKMDSIDDARNFFMSTSTEISPYDFYKSIMNGFINNIRILSLTENYNNLLMWGHYADSYKGVVIEFKINKLPFKLHPVKYESKAIEINGLYLNDFPLSKKETREEILSIYLTKNKNWEYEKEWRLATDVGTLRDSFNSNSPDYICYPSIKKTDEYTNIMLSKDSIRSIFLGSEINIIDEYQIIQIAKKLYPTINIYKGKLNKKEFKIDWNSIY